MHLLRFTNLESELHFFWDSINKARLISRSSTGLCLGWRRCCEPRRPCMVQRHEANAWRYGRHEGRHEVVWHSWQDSEGGGLMLYWRHCESWKEITWDFYYELANPSVSSILLTLFWNSIDLDHLNISRFAAFLYTLEGKTVIERVWEETLNELDFAYARATLDSMKAWWNIGIDNPLRVPLQRSPCREGPWDMLSQKDKR